MPKRFRNRFAPRGSEDRANSVDGGQDGLFDAQFLQPKQPQIGRHPVTGLDEYHITGYQLLGWYLISMTFTNHDCLGRPHVAQRIDGFFCLAFLIKTDNGIDDHYRDNDGSIDDMTEERPNAGRGYKDVNQDIMEM